MAGFVERFFGVRQSGSSPSVELRAGLTTFLTMAYILFVNPAILGDAITVDGPDVNLAGQLLTVTAIAAAIGSILMGFLARYPFALAPGMGLNAYFAYAVVIGQGVDWRVALGAVFVSGLIFLALSATGIRAAILRAIPTSLRCATAAGIGMFLALMGAKYSGLVVASEPTLVTLGDVGSPGVLLCLGGVIGTAVLQAVRVPGAILLGILAVTIVAIVTGAPVYEDGKAFAGFDQGFIREPVWPGDILFALDIEGALSMGILGIVLTFTLVDLLDTAGTLMGLADKAGVLEADGDMPRASRAFSADAVATSIGALMGTSTTTSYVESAAGVEAGGRTGLTAVVVGVLFLCSVVLWPLAAAVPPVATAPALLLVGASMMSSLQRVDWKDVRQNVPAFLILLGIPFTFSIANGISLGIIAYALIHLFSGRPRAVHPLLYVLAALLLARFTWLVAAE